ncbi:MAG TPA: hypothetical protein VEI50_16090 [Nitrospiraceae bacterium]|nr:hypothetical protein [Nitrospiraceae bacterium]
MNDQHVEGSSLLKYLIVPQTHRIGKWSRSVAAILIVIVMGLNMIPPGSTLASDQVAGTDGSDDTGIQVASWLLTIPYCAAKSAFAIAGSVVGGLGYAFSGGNSTTAENIWTTSVYGTYILRPAHLRGEEPVHFLGKAEDGSTPRPVQHASGTAGTAKK